jgi:ABC-type transporter Mla MlaB component
MSVEISFDSKNYYIQVKGELVEATVMDALKQFARECQQHDEWVIDFTRVTRVDSTALALLIELKRNAASKKREISFIYLPEALLTIARLSQVEDLLTTSR